jgi:steroid delta-isomerase-like uncharacterized protein
VTIEESNKALVRRYFDEIMNGANPAAMDELIAKDCVFTIPTLPNPFYGPDGYRQLVNLLRTAFPDLLFKVEDELAEGDTVVDRWSATGTSLGPFNGKPPNGKRFEIEGIGWYRMRDGQFIENRVNEDTLGLLTQIGIVPEQGTPSANTALAKRFFNDFWNENLPGAAATLVSDDFALELPNARLQGPAGLEQWGTIIRTGLPDVHFTLNQTVAQDDHVAVYWTAKGTQRGPLMGVPPTNKSVSLDAISLFRVANGKIAQDQSVSDLLGLMQQMGAIPAPAQTASADGPDSHAEALLLMPSGGRSISALGSTLTVKVAGKDTGGAWSLSHITVPANFVAQAPPPHYHTRDEEMFYVTEGTITFRINGKDVRAPAGSLVKFPRRLVHMFYNPDPTPAAVLVLGSPAGIEDYLVEVYQLLQQSGPPDPAKMNAIFLKYGLIITGPPITT